jgi:fluoride exporter
MIITLIYIGIGGFIGSILRFILSRYLNSFTVNFPLGTLCVNVIGSFVLGFIVSSLAAGKEIPSNLRDLLTIGLIGGFTTMSSFAYESFRLTELNEYLLFGLNISLNIILSLAAVYFGKELSLIISK